ncbi:MAG: hypothetical protein IT424_00515 [Pirellulales bacterium]|nr:hypothetical protein [Pirellulales bacterium]
MIALHPRRLAPVLVLIAGLVPSASAQPPSPRSVPIAEVLRQPLPAENLVLNERQSEILIHGPTFSYAVDRRTGLISKLAVRRDGADVLTAPSPVVVRFAAYSLTPAGASATTTVSSSSPGKVVLSTTGELKGPVALPFGLETTFFSDGVVVTRVTVTPAAALAISDRIEYAADLEGRLQRYFHKCHQRYDSDSGGAMLPLPAVGEQADAVTTTSCLQVMSHQAAAAIFTDLGAYHIAPAGLAAASLERKPASAPDRSRVVLTQRIARIGDGGSPLQLPAGKPFSFRLGLCVAPNRHPHPRSSELRHFTWVGDDRRPYPTNEEIEQVAQLGFNVFQIHRLGLLGQPRPPRGELERVIAQVHQRGMLLILLTLPDLLDAHSPRLQQMQADGQWYLWEANNYGGRYTATMDSYVDYYGTCVGAPNGLDDYHLETAAQMLDRFDVDGIYLDDNITQGPSCPHWQAHGHPRPGYDCLIELHEVNWRRRRLLHQRVPHALLVDHCTIGLWLPLLSPFDVHLYGEGHSISTLNDYWNFYGMINSMNAHGNLWPGGMDGARFATPGAYVLDLLTGGGQYAYIDWRLFTDRFSYAAGVLSNEKDLLRAFNLAQHYFGMHESTPIAFADAPPLVGGRKPSTAIAAYRNRTWDDCLLVVGNIHPEPATDSLELHQPDKLGVDQAQTYGVFDVLLGRYRRLPGRQLNLALQQIELPGDGLRLFYLQQAAADRPQHVWGGKRIEELWHPAAGRLALRLSGPAGLADTVFLSPGPQPISAITVNGQPASFAMNPEGTLLHGPVTFRKEPILLEVEVGTDACTFPVQHPARQSPYLAPQPQPGDSP